MLPTKLIHMYINPKILKSENNIQSLSISFIFLIISVLKFIVYAIQSNNHIISLTKMLKLKMYGNIFLVLSHLCSKMHINYVNFFFFW